MGGCATKPKVTKDGGVDVKAPETEPEQVKEDTVETKVDAEQHEPLLQSGFNLDVDEIVDDDQANKRRSLSLLFNKENEDAKVFTENEKTEAKETVKQETLEAEKPLEDAKTNEPAVKNESPKTEEKLSQESKNNEPAAKQAESTVVVDGEKKPSLQNQISDSAEETVNTETPEEAKKTSEETSKINEPAEETVVKQTQNDIAAEVIVVKTETSEAENANASEEIQSNELNEAIKQEKSSETTSIEDVVVPLPKEKVIEVVLTNAESVENKAVEATSSIEEKNHVDVGVEHASKT